MIHHIPNVLNKDQVQFFRQEMDKAEWVNGKVTAGTLSATVKHNQQLPEEDPLTHQLSNIILDALGKHGEFKHEVRQFQKPYDNQQAEQISLMV